MGKKQTTTDILSSPFKGVSIDIRNKMKSAFALVVDTLDPEDYITYRVLLAAIADIDTGGGGILRYTVNPGDPEVSYDASYSRLTVSYASGAISGAIGPGFPLIRQLLINQGGDDYYEVGGSHVTVPAGEVSTVYWEGAMDQATYDAGNWFVTLGN